MNIITDICPRLDVQGVIIIPWSVLSKSPPKALSSLKEEIEKKEIKLNFQRIQSEVKIQFHKDLFHKVFREFVLNMCKHCEKNVNADLTVVNNIETVEVRLIHPGVLKHDTPFGTGEEMIKELVCAHKGEFTLPHKVEDHKIESKITVRRW